MNPHLPSHQISPDLLKSPISLNVDNFATALWGGTWIPAFKGIASKAGERIGESWEFSTHPRRPSQAEFQNGTKVPLNRLIADYPRELLGGKIVDHYGPRSPLLVKLVAAEDDLSVQVHPDESFAREHESDNGKSESWFILDTDASKGGGFIYLGFNPEIARRFPTLEAFKTAFKEAMQKANDLGVNGAPDVRSAAERVVLPFLNKIAVKRGEAYDVPAGTIHSIGRGVRLFEIQQNSDITYRVWDWNRPDPEKLKAGKNGPRPLHMEKSLQVLDFEAKPASHYLSASLGLPSKGVSRERIVVNKGAGYAAELISLESGQEAALNASQTFQVVTVISGTVRISVAAPRVAAATAPVRRGRSVLLPAIMASARLLAESAPAQIIRSYVPG